MNFAAEKSPPRDTFGYRYLHKSSAPNRREKFCGISALFLRAEETKRGINCTHRVIYQFPRGPSLLSAEMIPVRGIVYIVGIFSGRTLTPAEG